MILKNNKGAALMQVLLVTVVLAGMSAMLLRATLSRTMTVRQTRRNVSTQIMADSCMAEVNSLPPEGRRGVPFISGHIFYIVQHGAPITQDSAAARGIRGFHAGRLRAFFKRIFNTPISAPGLGNSFPGYAFIIAQLK